MSCFGASIIVTPKWLGIGQTPDGRWIAYARLATNYGHTVGLVHVDVTEEVEAADG